MRLIRDDIIVNTSYTVAEFCTQHSINVDSLYNWQHWMQHLPQDAIGDYTDACDALLTQRDAARAQTFLFDHQQIVAFLADAERDLPAGDYPAPFPRVIIQFGRGLAESQLIGGESDDELLGLIIVTPEELEGDIINITAWYRSDRLNRVQLLIADNGDIEYNPLSRLVVEISEAEQAAQQRIANLGLLCLAYITSPTVVTEHVQPDAATNRKRAAKGKRELPDYYICRVRRQRQAGQDESTPTGRHVSFRFDVSGHFRRLSTGRAIWIRAHQRGVDHDLYKPKVYEMD